MSWPRVVFLVIDGLLVVALALSVFLHPEKRKAPRADLLASVPTLLISAFTLLGRGHIVLDVVVGVVAVVVLIVVGKDADLFRMEW